MKTCHGTFYAAAPLHIQHRSIRAAVPWSPAGEQGALPTRRCLLLTGRRNPSCLEPFWLLEILHPSGHLAPSWLFRPAVAKPEGAKRPLGCPLGSRCPPGHSASPDHLLSSQLFSNLLLAQSLQATRLRAKHSASSRQPIQCPPSHSAPC